MSLDLDNLLDRSLGEAAGDTAAKRIESTDDALDRAFAKDAETTARKNLAVVNPDDLLDDLMHESAVAAAEAAGEPIPLHPTAISNLQREHRAMKELLGVESDAELAELVKDLESQRN